VFNGFAKPITRKGKNRMSEQKYVVNPEVVELGKLLIEHCTVNGDNGTIEIDEKGLALAMEHDGIDPELHKKYQNFDGKYLSAATYAAGHVGIDFLAENPQLDELTIATHKVNNDTITGVVQRTSQVSAGPATEGKKQEFKTVFGNTVMNWTKKGTRNSTYKHVRKTLQEYGLSKLAD